MFGSRLKLRLMPVLAGSASADTLFKQDATGNYQNLQEPPKIVVYDNYYIPTSAPMHDGVAQVLGDSMENWNINNTDILLFKRKFKSADLKTGRFVIALRNHSEIERSWLCVSHIKSVKDDGHLILETSVDGRIATVTDDFDPDNVIGLATFVMPAPKVRPHLETYN